MVRRLELKITPRLAGIKVDTLLRKHLGLSGTVIKRIKWLEDGILCDGQRVNTRFLPLEGQILSVRLSDPQRQSGIVPTPGPLNIVYEDEDIIVLNKQAGVSVHPGPGHFNDTLGNFLLYYYISTEKDGDFHPVHRLDRGTSGLLVCAKHPHAQERLKLQLHTDQFRRTDLAICEGCPTPSSGIIDVPLGPQPDSLMAQMVRPDGKPARTHYHTLQTQNGRSVLQLVLETGRTHQIRVHMAHLGHPLTGDFLYGTEAPHFISRPALHSHQLEFLHPISRQPLSFLAPLPEDMISLLASP